MSGNKRSNPSGRKGVHHGVDLIALGSKSTAKSSRHSTADGDDNSKSTKPSGSSNPSKKFKPAPSSDSAGLFSDPIRVSQVSQQSVSSVKQSSSGKGSQSHSPQPSVASPLQQIIEVRSSELLSAIRAAKSSENDSKAGKILAGALKQLRLSRLKPDTTLNSALVTLVKEFPALFSVPSVIDGLVQVLKREPSIIFKAKSNPAVYISAAQLLLFTLKDSHDWPDVVAKVYIEDALGDRVWVDLDACRELVANICTLFATKPYTSGSTSSAGSNSGAGFSGTGTSGAALVGGASTGKVADGGDASGAGEGPGGGDTGNLSKESSLTGIETAARFSAANKKSLKVYVLQSVQDQLGRHSIPTDNVSRNLLKFFTAAVGLPDVRLLVAQKVDSWIQNPKLGKLCQELLMTVAVNCHAHSAEDIKVIETLINIRLKTKLFSSQFVSCVKELIGSHSANFATVMRGVVNNELGQYRSPSNMALLSMMVHSWPDEAAKLLGTIFQEFLTRKEDYLRALRGFVREIVRVVRNEFNYTAFVRSLMQERSETEFTQLEPSHKERMVHGLADLICVIGMLTASVLIREAYNGYIKGDRGMVSQLNDFFSNLGLIQRDSVWWVHTVVPTMFRPQPAEYKACLRKVLFLESGDVYNRDGWPPEADRSMMLKMMGEACLKEDTLMRVLVIGLTRELPLSAADAMDIADVLVARAASVHTDDIHRLPSIERKELFSAIFDITTYRPPANIQLPDGYHPPSLSISKLYWKGWLILLVLSAFNPKTVAATGWSDYPMLRGMMEMVMTSSYTFPMSTNLEVSEEGVVESKDTATVRELQLARTEKEAILEYENHLASSSGQKVTESTSYLLNQVTMLNPKGPSRKLPPTVIELVKTVNRTLSLGQLLCRCRSPDFLLSIIKKQGTSESMKWLTDLVESSHSSMEVLPVPCLCEFLMASYQDQLAGSLSNAADSDTDPNSHRSQYKRKKSAKDKAVEKHRQLLGQLQNLIFGPKSTPQSCSEVLTYFLEKLTLSHITPRKLAMNALHDILAKNTSVSIRTSSSTSTLSEDTEDEDFSSGVKDGERLVSCLPTVTHFAEVLPQIYRYLLQSCLVETNLSYLQHFLLFLTQNYPSDKLYESVIGLSRLIVDRFDIIQKILSPPSSRRSASAQGTTNVILLSSLFELFHRATEAAINSQTVPQVTSSSDFLLVTFPVKSQKALIHMALIQAIYLLLSLGPPLGAALLDFAYLRDLWAPSQPQNKPEAHTMEDKATVSLPPKEVLLYTLLSQNSAILEASLAVARPSQLCDYVQRFGCPVPCMERVLDVLDNTCQERDSAAELHHCISDPVMMARVVEIQMLRGVESGTGFLTFVRGLASLPPVSLKESVRLLQEKKKDVCVCDALLATSAPPATPKLVSQSQLKAAPQKLHTKSTEDIEQYLLQIFCQFSEPKKSQNSSQLKSLQCHLEHDLKLLLQCDSAGMNVSGLVSALFKVTTSNKVKVIEGMLQTRFAITLFRLLTRCVLAKRMDQLTEQLRKTVDNICKFLQSSRYKLTKLRYYHSFIAVLKASSQKLGVEGKTSRFSSDQKELKMIRDIKKSQNLLQMEPVIVKVCHEAIQGQNLIRFESLVKLLVKKSLSSNTEDKCIKILQEVKAVVSSICSPLAYQSNPELFTWKEMLLSDKTDSMEVPVAPSSEVRTGVPDISGLMVDVIEILDSEIYSISTNVTMKFLFGYSETFQGPLQGKVTNLLLSGQGFLLACLVNNSSWVNLLAALEHVLDRKNFKEWVNPSAVLDFIWGCLHKPCLWQERVKREAVVNSSICLGIDEDSKLNLSREQLETMLCFILKEAALFCRDINMDSTAPPPSQQVTAEMTAVLKSRLPLLICCISSNQHLHTVVHYLQTNTSYPSLSWQLVVHLYYANEKVIFLVDQSQPLTASALEASSSSKLDSVLHGLISAMADSRPGVSSHQRVCNAAMQCCKLTMHHPALVLRQLPMLGWMLNGRAHLRPSEFRNRNHKSVFENVFTILELLQPLVFSDSQAEALNLCLEAFFGFMKNHCCESKKYQDIVNRFSDFLVQYAHHNRDKAVPTIIKNVETLRPDLIILHTKYGSKLVHQFNGDDQLSSENSKSFSLEVIPVYDMRGLLLFVYALIVERPTNLRSLSDLYTNKKSSLKHLVESFPKVPEGFDVKSVRSLMIVPPLSASQGLTHEQVLPFLKKLENGQEREDILKVLQDLKETSLHSVDILKHFVPELCRIVQEPEPESSKLAHDLLLRHLKRSPSAVVELLPTFVSCLESQDYGVVRATLPSVQEVLLLCNGSDAHYLLMKLFRLATSSFGCAPELLKCIEAFTHHTVKEQ